VGVKVAVLVACLIATLGGGAGGSRFLSPRRSNTPHVGLSARSRTRCLPRDNPSPAPSGRELANGANLTVDEGQVVYVTLEEPEEIEPAPNSFPWPTPKSSNTKILAPAPICKYPERITSEALTVTAFRAIGTGTATVTAPLSRAWKKWQANPHQIPPSSPQEPFQSFRANVTVARN
jgi:hypothetical protein